MTVSTMIFVKIEQSSFSDTSKKTGKNIFANLFSKQPALAIA